MKPPKNATFADMEDELKKSNEMLEKIFNLFSPLCRKKSQEFAEEWGALDCIVAQCNTKDCPLLAGKGVKE